MKWPWQRKTAANRLADEWERSSLRLLKRLKDHSEQLKEIGSVLKGMVERAQYDMDQLEKLERQHTEAIDALRAENTILAETTVPTLVAQNELILKRVEADTALQIQRQLAVGGRREE